MYDDALRIFAGIDTDGVKSGMKEVKSLVDKGMNAVKSVTSAGISAVSGVAKAVTDSVAVAGSGVLAFGGYAIKVGTNFESSMSQVIATMGITKDTIQDGENSYKKLADKAKEMGETTKFSASEAADALNYLALAGYDAQKSCDALPAVLQLAQAGNMDLARTSDLVTDAMSALGIDATIENLTHFGDVLAKTSSKSNTSVQQLGEALLVCGGQSKLAGLELEETSTLLGILADNGIKGSEGGTALRNLLKNMYTPTSQASKALENLSLSFEDGEGHLKSAQTLLIETMSALENLSEADKMQAMSDIFDTRTIAAASATLNNSSERYNELYGEITKCAGAMEQMSETQNDNLQGDFYSLKSAVEAVGISVSEKLNPKIRKTVQALTEYVRDLNSAFKIKGFTGFAQSLGDILGEAVTKVAEKIPRIINIGADVVKSFIKGVSDNADILGSSASQIIMSLANAVIELFPQFVQTGGQLVSFFVQGIANNFSELTEKAEGLVQWIYDGIIQNLPKILDLGMSIVEDFGDKLSENSEKIISAGAEIISVFVDAIKKGIPKIIKVAKQTVKNFANAIGKEIPVLKPFAKVIKFVADNFELLAGMAVGVWTAFKGYTVISKASKAVSLLGDAVKVAGAVITANPLGLALMGIAGIATALISLDAMAGDYKTNLDKAIKKEQEYIEKIDERQKDYQNLKDEATKTASENLAPVDHISDLAKELDNLADASGRVKSEDVERVNYILQTMNDVLGTDYSLVDGQIQKYDELKKSINDVIDMKRAEILLDSNEEIYAEALKSYTSVENELVNKSKEIEAQKNLIENLAKDVGYSLNSINDIYGIAVGDYDEVYGEYLNLVNSGKINTDVYDFDAWIEQIDHIQKQADMYGSLQTAYNKLDQEANTYYADIEKYERASGAFKNGNYAEAEKIITNGIESLERGRHSTEKSVAAWKVTIAKLQSDVEDKQINFDIIKEKYEKGIPGVTSAMVEKAKSELTYAKETLFSEYLQAYEHGADGILESSEYYDEQIKLLADYISEHTGNSVADVRDSIENSGSLIGGYLIAGMIEKIQSSRESLQTAVNASVNMLKNMFTSGLEIHSPSKLMRDEVGKWILPGIAVGVEDTISDTAGDINNSIDNMASQIESSGIADTFISRAESILSNIGISSVPQYSQVYSQVQSTPENREKNKIELTQNSGQNIPKINVYIGDTEIKDFVMSAIYEANAVSGGASV